MIIGGLQKMTMLDFPGKIACTVFTQGCNFKCPFCHNRGLVLSEEDIISEDEVFSYLKKRVGILDGVCVTGGEPLLQKDIIPFMRRIKELGFEIKLDTNGSIPEKLREIISEGLVDYIAMDVKNTAEKYSLTSGCTISYDSIEKSIELIKNSGIPHEFRTTVVKELHTKEDIISIAKKLGKTEKYYLQQFKDSGNILCDSCSAHPDELLIEMAEQAKKYTYLCETRGI